MAKTTRGSGVSSRFAIKIPIDWSHFVLGSVPWLIYGATYVHTWPTGNVLCSSCRRQLVSRQAMERWMDRWGKRQHRVWAQLDDQEVLATIHTHTEACCSIRRLSQVLLCIRGALVLRYWCSPRTSKKALSLTQHWFLSSALLASRRTRAWRWFVRWVRFGLKTVVFQEAIVWWYEVWNERVIK